MPEPDPGFAARCRELCPRFRAHELLPARKSVLLAGDIDGTAVVAKRLAGSDAVWAWYFAREVAIYRAFAATPPPVRVPALVAAADDVLIVERVPGVPLASRRRPRARLDDATLQRLLVLRLDRWAGAWPSDPPPAPVRAQLRARFLEDPTGPWIRDGIERAACRGLLAPPVATRMLDVLATRTIASHGDLLLRNVVGDALVDWECAGPHLVDWDLALLATQLAPEQRPLVEAAASDPRSFRALVVFALVRELAFVRAFGKPRGAGYERLRRELATAVAAVGS